MVRRMPSSIRVPRGTPTNQDNVFVAHSNIGLRRHLLLSPATGAFGDGATVVTRGVGDGDRIVEFVGALMGGVVGIVGVVGVAEGVTATGFGVDSAIAVGPCVLTMGWIE